MGNQPSSPASPTPPSNPPPPITVSCDADCRRQKDLKDLKYAMDLAAKNKSTEPEVYEQARIKYYTLLDGQKWLKTEQERIAKSDIEPIVSAYTTKYSDLKKEQRTNSTFINLANSVKSQQADVDDKNKILEKQIETQKNTIDVKNRLYQLAGMPAGSVVTPYLPIILDVIIGILSIIVAYLLFTKIGSLFSVPEVVEEPIMSAGKRR